MTSIALNSLPGFGRVIREQFKAAALSLHLPAIGVAFVGGVASMLAFADFLRGRGGVEFAPELSLIPAFAGVALPIALWRNEQRFGPGFLWTLPVDRLRHAFAKVFAGWLLLMSGVTLFVAWLLILALITRGNITGGETITLLPTPDFPRPGTMDPSMLRTVRWIPQPALWLTPFFAATGAYAAASAFTLGFKHPFRWIIGSAALVFLIAAISHGVGGDALSLQFGQFIQSIAFGKYGLDGLLTARTESLKTTIELTTGEIVTVWRSLPSLADWLGASALWIGGAFAALTGALMRHREHR